MGPGRTMSFLPSAPVIFLQNTVRKGYSCKCPDLGKLRGKCRAMVPQTAQGQAATAYAKQVERHSAKGSLLLAEVSSSIANLLKFDAVIKDGYANVAASMKLSIESRFIVTTKLSVEGPVRMKEEYIEGIFESPKVDAETIPKQLRGAFGQAASSMQQLPCPIKDAVAGGLKIPLGGFFERVLMISYLDEEILIIRDTAGAPEVLTRLDSWPPSTVEYYKD